MHRRKKVDEKFCVTPAGTSNELDVQNEWEENTHRQPRRDEERQKGDNTVYCTVRSSTSTSLPSGVLRVNCLCREKIVRAG